MRTERVVPAVHHHGHAAVAPARLVFKRRPHPHARVVRTFVVTFATWSLFLVYLLAFSF